MLEALYVTGMMALGAAGMWALLVSGPHLGRKRKD